MCQCMSAMKAEGVRRWVLLGLRTCGWEGQLSTCWVRGEEGGFKTRREVDSLLRLPISRGGGGVFLLCGSGTIAPLLTSATDLGVPPMLALAWCVWGRGGGCKSYVDTNTKQVVPQTPWELAIPPPPHPNRVKNT